MEHKLDNCNYQFILPLPKIESRKAETAAHLETRQLAPFSCDLLLQLFPFGILITPGMVIAGAGEKLIEVCGGKEKLLGQPVTKFFRLRRPKGIPFTWNNVRYRTVTDVIVLM